MERNADWDEKRLPMHSNQLIFICESCERLPARLHSGNAATDTTQNGLQSIIKHTALPAKRQGLQRKRLRRAPCTRHP